MPKIKYCWEEGFIPEAPAVLLQTEIIKKSHNSVMDAACKKMIKIDGLPYGRSASWINHTHHVTSCHSNDVLEPPTDPDVLILF